MWKLGNLLPDGAQDGSSRSWSAAPLWMLMCALGVSVATGALRLGPRSAAAATTLGWSLAMWLPPLRLAVCMARSVDVPPDAHDSFTLTICPSGEMARMAATIVESFLLSGWRIGVSSALLLLPPGWQLLASLANTSASVVFLLLYYSRYGVATAADSVTAAVAPLSLDDVRAVLLTQPLLHMCVCGLAGGVVLPVALSAAAASLQLLLAKPGARARRAGSGSLDAAAAKAKGQAVDAAGTHNAAAPDAAGGVAPQLRIVRPVLPPAPQQLIAAVAAAAAGGQRIQPYRSSMRWATLSVKVRSEDGATGAAANIASAMPGLLTTALAHAAAARGVHTDAAPPAVQAAPPAPVLASYVGFRGCLHSSAVVAADQGHVSAHHLAAAVQQLLPTGVELISVAVADEGPHPAASSARGAWLDPVALPVASAAGDADVALHLPVALVAWLAAQGCGLRVIVSVPAHDAPFQDLTLRPGEDGWPSTGGALALRVPADAGPLALVTLLAAPPASGSSAAAPAVPHGADVFIAALPLLALPPAACAEALALWDALRGPAVAPSYDSGATFAAAWAPLAFDLGYGQSEGLLEAEARRALLAYLTQHELRACAALVGAPQQGGQSACAGPPAAAEGAAAVHAERASSSSSSSDEAAAACSPVKEASCKTAGGACGAPNPPRALPVTLATALAGAVWGFGDAGAEAAYVSWKGSSLVSWDVMMVCLDLARMGAWLVMLPSIVAGVAAPKEDAQEAIHVLFCACTFYTTFNLVPALALMTRPRAWYARHRGTLIAGGTALGGLAGYSVVHAAAARGVGVAGMGPVLASMISRPVVLPVSMSVLQPALRRLAAGQEALAAMGGALLTSITLEPMLGSLGLLFYLKWAFVSVAVAGTLDCAMRWQWMRERVRGSGSLAISSGKAAAVAAGESKGKKVV